MSRNTSPPPTALVRLLDGETLDAPPPLGPIEAVELLDFMADVSHGPTGGGPESPGAAFSLRVLGYFLASDPEGRGMLDVVRRATAYESPAERRSPSATTASEAFDALQLLADVEQRGSWGRHWVPVALPTPEHARYALALLTSDGDLDSERFSRIADYLVEHEDAGEEDATYVERLRAGAVSEPRVVTR